MTDLSFHQADPGLEVSVKPGMAQGSKGPSFRLVLVVGMRATTGTPSFRAARLTFSSVTGGGSTAFLIGALSNASTAAWRQSMGSS
jgi:hypothetical protein